ncbi:hypothetical protein VOLCADRAFT_88729 [Volvox carteri f. nagariensis]|uniref:Uncharacterized protein n=1 Tax=Volvox carteri f. nagariensis TaxID=3068 RepID=D8TPT2_VOLCA|nr:uncharacterized protein VOLCADRAFT_88729 [Volvox carteri f. nagariensis]EFJ50412.1 hypothetical protein VOLCADRAFT_88729 [Volvox carteri f. nagariensis]|eukprot:XP_002948537.1 hypothetical protein VOLCADRAFT_88729 [Volvox carteri f. nagariensis]
MHVHVYLSSVPLGGCPVASPYEYGFQALRCADKTSTTFTFKRGEELIRNTTSQLELEAVSELIWPSAKRGVRLWSNRVACWHMHACAVVRVGMGMETGIIVGMVQVGVKEWDETEAASYFPDADVVQAIISLGLSDVQVALGKDAGPGVHPQTIWHFVTRKVCGVQYDETHMHLLRDVCHPNPSSASTSGGTLAQIDRAAEDEDRQGEDEEQHSEEEEQEDEEEVAARETEERDITAADSDAGLVLAGGASSGDEGSDSGQEAAAADTRGGQGDVGPSSGTGDGRAGPRRARRPHDPILSSLHEFCRCVNACIARQGRDRVSGRFFGQNIRDAVARLTKDEQDHLSDDDYVAVLEEVGHQQVVRIALVERLLRSMATTKGKSSLEDASRLVRNDPAGRLVLRVLQPAGQGTATDFFIIYIVCVTWEAAWTACVERGFSRHRIIKNRLTNRLKLETVDSLLRVGMLGPAADTGAKPLIDQAAGIYSRKGYTGIIHKLFSDVSKINLNPYGEDDNEEVATDPEIEVLVQATYVWEM